MNTKRKTRRELVHMIASMRRNNDIAVMTCPNSLCVYNDRTRCGKHFCILIKCIEQKRYCAPKKTACGLDDPKKRSVTEVKNSDFVTLLK